MTFAQSALARALPFRKKHATRSVAAQFREFVRVRATTRVADAFAEVPAGAIGTIVHVHDNGKAFEVEFDAPTRAVLLAQRAQVEPE